MNIKYEYWIRVKNEYVPRRHISLEFQASHKNDIEIALLCLFLRESLGKNPFIDGHSEFFPLWDCVYEAENLFYHNKWSVFLDEQTNLVYHSYFRNPERLIMSSIGFWLNIMIMTLYVRVKKF